MALSAPEALLVQELIRLLNSNVPLAEAKRRTGIYTLKYKCLLSIPAQEVIKQISYDHRICKHLKSKQQ